MSSPAPTRRRGTTPYGLRLMLIVAFALGVAATVLVVVFSDETRWLRIGVLLALWAALIAAFAVARSRREAQSIAAREAEITRTYELELHREVAARREFETSLNERIRDEAQHQQNSDIEALRAQLERLTSTLSTLLDGDVLVERLTLSAEATRLRGIGDAGRGRLSAASRPELSGSGQDSDVIVGETVEDTDSDDDTVDAELVDTETDDDLGDSVGGVDGVAADGSYDPDPDPDPEPEPRADAPATGWAQRHRTDVLQAAATVAADLAAEQREAEELGLRQAAEARQQEQEQERLAAEAEQARLAAEAEQARLAAEAEQARLAEEAEQARQAAEEAEIAERSRLAEEAEQARQAAEEAEIAERARLADEAEQVRLAEQAEQARHAAEAEPAVQEPRPSNEQPRYRPTDPASPKAQPIPAMRWVPGPGPSMPWPPPHSDLPAETAASDDGGPHTAPIPAIPAQETPADAAVPVDGHHDAHQLDGPGRVSAADLLAAFGAESSPRRRRRRAED